MFLDFMYKWKLGIKEKTKERKMEKFGLIILGIILLGAILVLTLVMKIIEFFLGVILFLLAIVLLIYLYTRIKNKVS